MLFLHPNVLNFCRPASSELERALIVCKCCLSNYLDTVTCIWPFLRHYFFYVTNVLIPVILPQMLTCCVRNFLWVLYTVNKRQKWKHRSLFDLQGRSRVKIIGEGADVGGRLYVTYFNESYLIGNIFNTRTLIYSDVCYNNKNIRNIIKKTTKYCLLNIPTKYYRLICINIWL